MAQAVAKHTTWPYENSFCHFQRMESIMPFIAVGHENISARPTTLPLRPYRGKVEAEKLDYNRRCRQWQDRL
jgi:hypothetical protein